MVIDACLADMCEVFGAERMAFIGREMTKMHEQCVQETLGELRRRVDDGSIVSKGEFVVVVAGETATAAPGFDIDRLLLELTDHLPAKDVARIAARVSGEKKNELYERLLQLKKSD
jgi:16S rRNA (cytidine1402-2'-O)-methyltransferase